MAFVLSQFTPYEGHTLLGVYSTREHAEAAVEQFKSAAPNWAHTEGYETLEIEEVKIDGPPLCPRPGAGCAEKWQPIVGSRNTP